MSANRSVQAAQRRRAGPSQADPGIPGRGPQPSINSSQMFNQARPGNGPNMPTGRLAGQHAQQMQQQYQQQQYQQQQQQPQTQDMATSGKQMTIPQAITLITLRLGAVEQKLLDASLGTSNFVSEDGEPIDNGLLQSVVSRLESLEKRSVSTTTTASSSPEINLIKQQLDTIQKAFMQYKASNVSMQKDITFLKNEISTLKDTCSFIQNTTLEHGQKIMELSMGIQDDGNGAMYLGDVYHGEGEFGLEEGLGDGEREGERDGEPESSAIDFEANV